MVQVIPQGPSLAELLGGGIGAGVQTGLQGKMELMQKLKLEEQKQKQTQDLIGSLFGGQEQIEQPAEGQAPDVAGAGAQDTQLERIATNPQAMMQMAAQNPQMAAQIQNMYGNLIARRKEERKAGLITPETKERMADTFQRQEELMKEGNIGLGISALKLTPKHREARAEFNTLSSSIEAALLPMLNKGVLSKPRFDYIMSLLPKATNTLATNRGKIKALRREFGMLEAKAPATTQSFNVGGKTYNIPADQVDEFKREMGIE